MNHFLFRPSSLYVLFTFFCFAFILVFYDSYRTIYYDANFFEGQAPKTPSSVHVERAVRLQYDKFMEEIDFFHERDIIKTANLDQRHKLRWLYKTVESRVYQAVAENISVRAALYAKDFHYALTVFVTLIFIVLTVERLRGGIDFQILVFLAFALYAYTALVSTSHRMYDQHSLIEMAAQAAGLYFALQRRMPAFVIVLFVALANRETGTALGVIYALINWRERLFWLPGVLGPVMLAVVNADLLLLPEFYNPDNFVVTKTNMTGYVHVFTLTQASFPLLAFTAIKTFTFFAPAFYVLPKAMKTGLGRRLLAVGAFFWIVLMFGTILGYLFPYAMLIPVIFALWAVAYPAAPATEKATPG
ncbi:MAG: hypothetical protein IT564_01695 [Rhodospirillales bacterium]|nr:hypothetical protein [Rhodospirillales bacterium]